MKQWLEGSKEHEEAEEYRPSDWSATKVIKFLIKENQILNEHYSTYRQISFHGELDLIYLEKLFYI